MRGASVLLLAGLLATVSVAVNTGCSSTTTTHTVERPATNEEGAPQTETTTTETHETSGPGVGILSGTIHVIGMILALPFKIIGGLIELIF